MDKQVNIPALSFSKSLIDAFRMFERSKVWTSLVPLTRDWGKVKPRPSQFKLKGCQEKVKDMVK